MGGSSSKYESSFCEKDVRNLKEKLKILQEEMKEMMCEKEKESRAYEREMMVYAFKEAEWKQERKKLKEEVKKLKMMVEDKEEKIREIKEAGLLIGKNSEKEWESLGIKLFVEHMKEERIQRDAAVEKWKQLYLEIKAELDDLIQRSYYHGEDLCWRAEEDIHIEKLKEEVEDKEGTITALKAQLASMENEKYKKERELDLLRQSLRIMSTKKSVHVKSKFLQSFHL